MIFKGSKGVISMLNLKEKDSFELSVVVSFDKKVKKMEELSRLNNIYNIALDNKKETEEKLKKAYERDFFRLFNELKMYQNIIFLLELGLKFYGNTNTKAYYEGIRINYKDKNTILMSLNGVNLVDMKKSSLCCLPLELKETKNFVNQYIEERPINVVVENFPIAVNSKTCSSLSRTSIETRPKIVEELSFGLNVPKSANVKTGYQKKYLPNF